MKVMVDYAVWLGVEVDTETGEVLRVAHGDEPWASVPEGFHNADSVEGEPEFWPAESPGRRQGDGDRGQARPARQQREVALQGWRVSASSVTNERRTT